MAASILRACLALLTLSLPLSQVSAAPKNQQPLVIDAQSLDLDYKNNNVLYHKVRIAQGNMSVTADQAQTTGVDVDNSHWVFRGNVKISMEQGQLTSDEAEITFTNKLLSRAVANGNPAAFEQHIAKTGKLAQGRAESIDYDVAKGVVHFSKNAWLTDGQNEIRDESLKYYVATQRIAAEGSEQGSQRVHVIITPPANPKP
jgi:lipopolysaccharide export system protein LptA